MKDHLLSWHEKFQPLGPALKTPRIEVDEAALDRSDFETRSYDHPSCTGGNAPSLSPQALVGSPAGREFKVGDRVRVLKSEHGAPPEHNGKCGVIGEARSNECGVVIDGCRLTWWYVADELEHISQPSDTQQWVEWKGGDCPLPKGTKVVVRYRCGAESRVVRAGVNESSLIPLDAGPAFWYHEACLYDIVAFRVVQ